MENKNWPDKVRLKMIEKSEFYPDDKQIYQYGFYDGYQYRMNNKHNTDGLRIILTDIHIAIQEDKPYSLNLRDLWNRLSNEITEMEKL
jgi:hypothetical protein